MDALKAELTTLDMPRNHAEKLTKIEELGYVNGKCGITMRQRIAQSFPAAAVARYDAGHERGLHLRMSVTHFTS